MSPLTELSESDSVQSQLLLVLHNNDANLIMEGQDAITLETSQYHIPHRDDQCPNSIFERLEFGAG